MTGAGEPSWLPSLRALVEEMTGRPLADLAWRELIPVRDELSATLNAAINRRQAPDGDAA